MEIIWSRRNISICRWKNELRWIFCIGGAGKMDFPAIGWRELGLCSLGLCPSLGLRYSGKPSCARLIAARPKSRDRGWSVGSPMCGWSQEISFGYPRGHGRGIARKGPRKARSSKGLSRPRRKSMCFELNWSCITSSFGAADEPIYRIMSHNLTHRTSCNNSSLVKTFQNILL